VVNVSNYFTGTLFAVLKLQILVDPSDEVVFECSLNQLVKKIWGDKFVDVCAGEIQSERLLESSKLGWKEKCRHDTCTTMSWMMP